MTTIIDKKLNYKNDDINTNISNDSKNNKVKKNDTRTRSNSSDNTSSFDPNESDSESSESKSSVSESEIEETILSSNNRKRKRLTEVDLSSHIKQKRKFSDATDNMKEVEEIYESKKLAKNAAEIGTSSFTGFLEDLRKQ